MVRSCPSWRAFRNLHGSAGKIARTASHHHDRGETIDTERQQDKSSSARKARPQSGGQIERADSDADEDHPQPEAGGVELELQTILHATEAGDVPHDSSGDRDEEKLSNDDPVCNHPSKVAPEFEDDIDQACGQDERR